MSKRFRAVVVPSSSKTNYSDYSITNDDDILDEIIDDNSLAKTPLNVTTTMSSRRRSARLPAKSLASTNDNVDELSVTETPIQIQAKRSTNGRTSTASASTVASTIDDSAEASGYTTPMTSGVPTPVPSTKYKEEQEPIATISLATIPPPRRRTRPALPGVEDVPESHKRAFQKARQAREAKAKADSALGKRKREFSDDDDLDTDDADVKLARALQEAEYAKGDSMDVDSEPEVPLAMSRRGRVLSRTTTKTTTRYVISDSEFEKEDLSDSESSKSMRGKSSIDTHGRRAQNMQSNKLEVLDSADDGSDFHMSDEEDVNFKPFSKSSMKPSKGKGKLSVKREVSTPIIKRESTTDSLSSALSETALDAILAADSDAELSYISTGASEDSDDDATTSAAPIGNSRRNRRSRHESRTDWRARNDRAKLEKQHPELLTMWEDLKNLPIIKTQKAEQPKNINRQLKPFQLEGLSWMQEMEKTAWGGGLLGDEMGMGKTIQAVSLIMSDWPAKNPSLVLVPPVALMQWQQEIGDYTDGTLKVFVHHGTNKAAKGVTVKELSKYDVILLSYNSLESMHRFEVSGRRRKVDGVDKMVYQKSVMHQIQFHRVILDEAHSIKSRQTGVARACFALKADHKWCLSGTPLQNRIGEFFSLVRFLDIRPFACYFCKQCPCSTLNWSMDASNKCKDCSHHGMQHVSVFNQELLNPIQKYGNKGLGKIAFDKLRLLTDRFMLRRVKRDHSSSMELPSKEIIVNRQFFGEVENDFAGSIMNNNVRKFETYVAQGVMLNNYANIFGLIMQMRQVADHPDLILKKSSAGGANILHCCVCDEPAEDAIRSVCKHDFCRECAKNYQVTMEKSGLDVECPRCHIPLAIDLEQPAMEQNETDVKKNSIINRIKMENWTSSSKIEALVHELHSLRSNKGSSKSIIFSQFSTMLQLVEWRLRRAGISTVMLDGSMTPAQRQASINKFMTDANIECFLVSLKAGGVALNLTEASKVFIIDPWWNPAAEWQSADRCHRIGQARPCTITRLCIEDSVESRMVQLQEKKANMINSTINSDESAMESLTPEDMQFLFRGN